MGNLRKPIAQHESISFWWTSELAKTALHTESVAFEGDVNLTEDYVQIIYPVRKAFLKDRNLDTIAYPQRPFPQLHVPFETNRLDFSTFLHTPHHLQVYAKTWIEVEQDGVYPFELYICGGMVLWVDGHKEVVFSPFTRNIVQCMPAELSLEKGIHELVLYAEELAERDVLFSIELRYTGFLPLVNMVAIDQNAAELYRGMELLKSLHFEKDFYEEGEICLAYDSSLITEPVYLTLSSCNQIVWLDALHASVRINVVQDMPVGIYHPTCSLSIGSYVLHTDLLVGIADRSKTSITAKRSSKDRKLQALHCIKKTGNADVTQALVLCELEGILSAHAESMVMKSLKTIEQKEDCSDFHLVPLLLLITRYNHLLSTSLRERIEQALFSYRYWMDEPGNDVMWFFSENHAFLFHIGQYVTGHLYPEKTFHVSGRQGSEQYTIGKNRLETWFDTFFTYGFAEWNSATYLPIDFLGFFILFDLAPDESIREMAKRALDFSFRLIAHNSYKGTMSCTFGRCYEDTLKFRTLTEISFLSFVAFGEGYITPSNRSAALFALSSYEPEQYTQEVQMPSHAWQEICLKQGISKANTYLFRTTWYQMGCVQRYRPYTHGHQQHLFNVVVGDKKPLQYFINHPGEPAFSGRGRPSYWAGNGTMPAIHQYRNLALLIFTIEETELVHAIHAYAPLDRMDAYKVSDHHFYFCCEGGYVSTYFSNTFSITTHGANTNRELISNGLTHAVVVRCSDCNEFPSFESFIADQERQDYQFDRKNLSLVVTDSIWGKIEVSASTFIVQGKEIDIDYHRKTTMQRGVFGHA